MAMARLLRIIQMAFFVSLLSICFFGFGLPCIKKFFDNEITVTESVEKKDSLKPPAITVCPERWKPDTPPILPKGHYRRNCGGANSTKDFEACVENKTFGFNEVIVSATQGYLSNTVMNLSDPQLWTSDLTLVLTGRCYTLNYDQLLKVDQETESVWVNLVPENYFVILHHPDFSLFTINPLSIPTTAFNLQVSNASYTGLILEMIQIENINRPEVPCNPSPDYKFTACVKESLAKVINCTLPWNGKIPGSLFLFL